jgi:transposase/DNA-binding MarR family transcriptional regulator
MSIQKNRGLTHAERVALLALIAEQVAIPLDQLARFLAVDLAGVKTIVSRLVKAGYLEQRCFLAGGPPWVWLTHKGAAASETDFAARVPTVRLLTHRRAVNEVRLYLRQHAPRGRWVCERTVARRIDPDIPLPDALLEIDGERHAIEVELNRKPRSALRVIVASHSNRYDAVLYFCSPQTRPLLDELRERYDWPKLSVGDVPGMEQFLATRTRGFGLPLREPARSPRVRWGHRRKQARLSQPWQRGVLVLLAEQGAIPLDQLSRFLDYEPKATDQLAKRLVTAKLAKRESLLANEADWVWLTEGGNRLSEVGFKTYLPTPGGLARLRAINEIRLHIATRVPQADWLGWRALRRELSGFGQIPKAVVEVDGERHAIEAELTRKMGKDAIEMVEHRSARYDAVVCFCTPKIRRFYEGLAAKNYWPKLVIYPLPTPPSEVAAPSSPVVSSAVKSPPARPSRKLFWQPARNPQRSEVDDGLWAELEPLISKDRRSGLAVKARCLPDRTALSGILYVLRHEINWPDLPHELGYGSGITCWERLRQWERAGVWVPVQELLCARLPDRGRLDWSRLPPA